VVDREDAGLVVGDGSVTRKSVRTRRRSQGAEKEREEQEERGEPGTACASPPWHLGTVAVKKLDRSGLGERRLVMQDNLTTPG
jgi:hypothetical protein